MTRAEPAYVDLADRCARIDRRHTRYQFDLEQDVPWGQLGEPGLLFGPVYLEALGIDPGLLEPEERERLQWALGLATCEAFHRLEELILRFAADEASRLGPTRSMELLCEEEQKHMLLFERYAEHLRAGRPELAASFSAEFERSRNLLQHLDEPGAYPSAAAFHYLFWVNTVFFEEYTVWIDDCLQADAELVQPAWLVAHQVHRQEEVQHLVTDVAHVEALNLSDTERYHLSKVFLLRLEEGFDRFFGVEAALRLVGRPELLAGRSFRALPLFQLLLESPAFKRTRRTAPCLEELARSAAPAREVAAGPAVLTGPELGPLPAESLAEVLRATPPEARLVYRADEVGELSESVGELTVRAERVLAGLRREGLRPGDFVMLLLPQPRDFVAAFWGCQLGGFVPAPLGLSIRSRAAEDVARLSGVHAQLGGPLVLLDADVRAGGVPGEWRTRSLTELTHGLERDESWAQVEADRTALVQFSSGSTGNPRGILLSQRNLIANMQAARLRLGVERDDVVVSWMPLHHDMGLAYHLTPFLVGATQVLLTPLQFARQPLEWLRTMHRHQATISASPNFGYAQVLRRVRPDRLRGLDLSRVRCVLNGAEPISLDLIDRFSRALASTGFQRSAIRPAYGLAEATVAVTTLPAGVPIREHVFERSSLDGTRAAVQVPRHHPRAAGFVGVGAPVPGVSIRVRSATGPVALGVVGEVQVRGPSVTAGYLGDPEATARAVGEDGWLRTGDLGLVVDGELVITGRAKDVVFVNGRNLFAEDLEAVLKEVAGISPDRLVVIGTTDSVSGLERVVPFVRFAPRAGRRRSEVVADVAARLGEAIAFPVERVVVLPSEFFPRTTSGKIQRHKLRDAFERGELDDYVLKTHARGESARLARQTSGEWAGLPATPVVESPWLRRVQTVWAEALGLIPEEVGLDQSFFALGGDSLLAVDVHDRLETLCGRLLDIRLLRECHTVRETAAFLQEELRAAEVRAPAREAPAATRSRDVAVVAMAGRFPGAPDLDAFWELLREGRVATRRVPSERWEASQYLDPDPAAPGKTVCVDGGFLEGIRAFDPESFGIAPDAARQIDPQQRIFLEVAADALAQVGPRTQRVGVFAGAGQNEYLQRHATDVYRITGQTAPANLENMLAARVSQRLGLTGPALTVNAACATSLVAVHLACRSLLEGECELAVAGGVQLNLTVLPFLLFSQAGVLSRTGRCRPFSQDADGFVPGEGAGAVVLKPLAAALRDHDPILGVIKGGAVNNDGGALSGMAPNPAGQREVLRLAYEQAGVDPASVDYVEAHGTGTRIGDPIEVRALSQVFGESARPGTVGLGSLKANLGHLLNAAGIASLIKVLLALRHGELPPTPGSGAPDPRIPFAETPFRLFAEGRPWARRDGRARRAGINAFGIGGTNCHLIVEEPPQRALESSTRDAHLLCLSGPDDAALGRIARGYGAILAEDPGLDLARLCATANPRAARFARRRALVLRDAEQGRLALERVAVRTGGGASTRAPQLLFLFPGPGSQFPGMGRHLLEAEPVVQAALEECEQVIGPLLGRSLRELYEDAAMNGIDCSQPVVFAFSYALARWLESLGVRPDAVIGHSAGEFAAAVLAGVFSLEEAARLVTRRGQHMSRTEPGRMAAVFADEERVRGFLAETTGVSVAALNEPGQVVISGLTTAVDQVLERLREAKVESRVLQIACAAHSPLMEPARLALATDLQGTSPRAPGLPFFSTLVGTRVSNLPRAYWADHLRAPVRFASAVRSALAAGHRTFLELSASAALSHCVTEIVATSAPELSGQVKVIPLLRRSLAGWGPTLEALGELFEAGVDLDPTAVDGPSRAHPIRLPGYPYQRRELWLEPPALGDPSAARPRAPRGELRFSLDRDPAIRDHRVHGTPLAPAALLFDRVLGSLSATHVGCALRDVVIGRPLVVEAGTERRARVREVERDGAPILVLESQLVGEEADPWDEHLSARYTLMRRSLDWPESSRDLSAVRARCPVEVPAEALYERLARGGLTYGPSLRTVRNVWRGEGELLARLELDAASEGSSSAPHRLHPGLVDGAMQAVAGLTLEAGLEDATFLGFAVRRVAVQAPVDRACFAHVRLLSELRPSAEAIRCDVVLLAPAGKVLAAFDEVCLKRFHPRERAGLGRSTTRFFGLSWDELPEQVGAPRLSSAPVVVLGRSGPLRTALEREVESAGGVALPADPPPAEGWTEFVGRLCRAERRIVFLEPEEDQLGALAQALAQADLRDLAGLMVVSPRATDMGFVRSLDRERPTWNCQLVRADPSESSPAELARAVHRQLGDSERLVVEVRDGARRVPALRPLGAPRPEAVEEGLRPRGVYWITGGLGGIGCSIAEALAARVGARLLLSGRRTHPDPEVLARIERAGGEALYVPADVGDREAMRRALEVAREAWGEVHGVIHAAGLLADALVGDRTPERSRAVVAAKVEGARVLAEVTTAEDLDFLVFFSSLSGLYGVPGQTDYAAANAFLDDFARGLRRGSTRILSLAWGPWRDVGMVREERYQRGFLAQGFRPLGPLGGSEAFLQALALSARNVAVADLMPEREGALLGAFNRRAGAAVASAAPVAVEGAGGVCGFLLEGIARHTRCDVAQVDPNATFHTLGVDSLMAVTLVRELERRYRIRLYPTLLFEFQTAAALAAHLESDHAAAIARASDLPPAAEPRAAPVVSEGDCPAYLVESDGGLTQTTVALDELGPQEVEIETRAIGVNFIDLLATVGMHPILAGERFVPGHEVAGVVRRVGAEVGDLHEGDRVMALVSRGGYAARVVAHQATTLPLPERMPFSDGAAIVITGLTAISCLEVKGRVAWGERVLVQAAAGATGLACVQLALHHGAVVFGTASSPRKLARLRSLGVAHPINYREESFDDAVRRITDGEGVDLIVDSLSGEAIEQGLAILRPGGRFVEIGAAGVVDVPAVDPKRLFLANQDFVTVNVARLEQSPAQLRAALDRLERLLRDGVLRPQVGHQLAFEEAAEAHRLLRERENVGKVVLVFP